jgi:hypothetical protein
MNMFLKLQEFQTPAESKKAENKAKKAKLFESAFGSVSKSALPKPVTEYRFCPGRQWRFDLAWPEYLLFVEIEGGTWGRAVVCNKCNNTVTRLTKTGKRMQVREGTGHTGGAIFAKNQEKYNRATLMGWRKMAFTTDQVKDGSMLRDLEEFFRTFKPIAEGK